jgi:hypothetical protein
MKKPLIYFRGRLETRHFEFEAFEVTESTARQAIIRAIRRHAKAVNMPADAMVNEYSAGIEVDQIQIGHAYRDRSVI